MNATWQMPFRPFFTCAAIFGLLAIPLWVLQALGKFSLPLSLHWHSHEMLIGFAGTVVIGFLLTAAQTWTGQRTVNGRPLMLLVALWCAGRVGWLAPAPWFWLGALGDLLLFCGAALVMARLVLFAGNWRNAFFVPVLMLFALFSPVFAYALVNGNFSAASALQNLAFFLIVHMVLVVGGRVIPFFSDRGLCRSDTPRWAVLEYAALLSSLLYLALVAMGGGVAALKIVAFAVATTNALRQASWKPWQCASVPLLWSLHLAYAFVVAGFAAIALNGPGSMPVHLIAVGGIGLMILAMMSRVSLGHTGRALKLPAGFLWAYVAMAGAAVCRSAASLVAGYYPTLLGVAALLWVASLGLFVALYFRVLIGARVDGKPG